MLQVCTIVTPEADFDGIFSPFEFNISHNLIFTITFPCSENIRCFYFLLRKLREGNIFSHVCLPVCSQGETVQGAPSRHGASLYRDHHPHVLDLTVQEPSLCFGHHCTGTHFLLVITGGKDLRPVQLRIPWC